MATRLAWALMALATLACSGGEGGGVPEYGDRPGQNIPIGVSQGGFVSNSVDGGVCIGRCWYHGTKLVYCECE